MLKRVADICVVVLVVVGVVLTVVVVVSFEVDDGAIDDVGVVTDVVSIDVVVDDIISSLGKKRHVSLFHSFVYYF